MSREEKRFLQKSHSAVISYNINIAVLDLMYLFHFFSLIYLDYLLFLRAHEITSYHISSCHVKSCQTRDCLWAAVGCYTLRYSRWQYTRQLSIRFQPIQRTKKTLWQINIDKWGTHCRWWGNLRWGNTSVLPKIYIFKFSTASRSKNGADMVHENVPRHVAKR